MMELKLYNRIIIHGLIGLFLGVFILHPVSMVLNSITLNGSGLTLQLLLTSFSFQHLLMAFYFSIIGLVFGIIHAYYIHIIFIKEKHIRKLEDYLAMCSHCRKIKILGKKENEETWIDIESYMINKSGIKFSHGICPECAIKLYPELIEEINQQ